MDDQDQQKWLKGFSWVGFLFPWIYLFRARKYLFAILAIIIPYGIQYIHSLLPLIFGIAIAIIVGIKGRVWAFEKTKKSFEDFKTGYRKTSKILIYILIPLLFIIFVGIFAASLLPRLTSVKGRADDTARRADLSMISVGLKVYQIDNGVYPKDGGCVSTIADKLISAGLDSVPKDPNPNNPLTGISPLCNTPGEYIYIPSIKNGSGGFIVIAKTESDKGSNRVFDKSFPLDTNTDLNSIKVCENIIKSSYTENKNNGTCYYKDIADLGYIQVMTD